ncbi:LysR family transcriptional regulator [Mangrovicoccus ximenensis]|uniref:LysR family transcriptional regulator n=1 Tax=Mangrovicoccus ximenensis TaxID=1911570 RepID=UPI002ED56973
MLERRNLPDLKLLQTFECAARHRNFTRAGEELALTQSAVSRQIRELEAQLGKPLFERVRGRVVPTPAGEVLRRRAAPGSARPPSPPPARPAWPWPAAARRHGHRWRRAGPRASP